VALCVHKEDYKKAKSLTLNISVEDIEEGMMNLQNITFQV